MRSQIGDFIRDELRARSPDVPGVKDIRGAGLMIGIELDCALRRARDAARSTQGLLINVTVDTVVRLLPPLIYTREEAELLVDKLVPLIAGVSRAPAAPRAPQAALQPA